MAVQRSHVTVSTTLSTQCWLNSDGPTLQLEQQHYLYYSFSSSLHSDAVLTVSDSSNTLLIRAGQSAIKEQVKVPTYHSMTSGKAPSLDQQWWSDKTNSGSNIWYKKAKPYVAFSLYPGSDTFIWLINEPVVLIKAKLFVSTPQFSGMTLW